MSDFRSRSNSGGRPLRSPTRTPGKARSASGSRKPCEAHCTFFADFSAEHQMNGDDDGNETFGVESSKIKVFVRIRPTYSRDAESVRIRCGEQDKSVTVLQGNKIMSFPCDTVFGERASQADVYERLGHNLLAQFVDGRNVCVFAYGQTGSGKTHSILGSENDPGLLPRFCRELFRLVGDNVKKEEVIVEASFFELYLEKAYDLLAAQRVQLRVRGADTAYLEGLTSVQVMRFHELLSVLETGVAKRATTATLVNEFSSRSHAIFQIVFRRPISEVVNGVERKSVVKSNCYFVDLAGSERLDIIGSGNRAETLNINCSLLALQKVIDAKAAPISTFVNYRESILTRLLKECFGGNSVTSLLATVSPEMQYTGVSIGTLRFASKAALVRQTPKANVDPFVSAVQDLKAENDEMRVELEKLRSHAQLSAQPPQKGRPSVCCRHEPCLVELFEDGALNVWFKVTTDGIAISAPAYDSPAFTCWDSGAAYYLTVHVDDVVINGTTMVKNKEVPMCNNDRIALGGIRFFVFCAQDESNAELPSFHCAKLEYVQSTFETLREKLREEAHQAFEQDRNEIVRQMNEQLKKTREELESVRAAQANDVGKVDDLAERKFDLENCAEETYQFQLTLVSEEPTDLLSGLRDVDDAEKMKLMELETNVSMINKLLVSFGKHDLFIFKLVQNAPSEAQRVCVRLHNTKARTFADLSYSEFDHVYESIVQIYHNSTALLDGVADVESILYGGDWKWTSSAPGRRSSIFSMALYNSMCDVARTRRRSVAQVQRTFTSRKSILSDAIEQAMNTKKLACQSALDTHFQMLIANQTDVKYDVVRNCPFTHNLIRWVVELGHCLRNADRQVKNCWKNTINLNCTGTSSPDQVAIYAVMRFIVAVARLEAAVLSVSCMKEPMDALAPEMLDIISVIAKDRDRWVQAVHSKSESSSFFVKMMNKHVNMLLKLIGRYAFLVGDRFPTGDTLLSAASSDDNLSASSFSNNTDDTEQSCAYSYFSTTLPNLRLAVKPREMFDAGVVQSMDAACEKNDELRTAYVPKASHCDLSAAALALCDGIETLQAAIKEEAQPDERVVFDVMRPLVYVRNLLLGWSPPLEEITKRLINLRTTVNQLSAPSDAQPSRPVFDGLRFVAGSVGTAIAKLQKARSVRQTNTVSPTANEKSWTRRVGVLTSCDSDGATDENRPPLLAPVFSHGSDNSIEGRTVIAARCLDNTIENVED